MRILYKWVQHRRGNVDSELPGIVLVIALIILVGWVGSRGRD